MRIINYISILFFFLVLNSCKKETKLPPDVAGSWNWISTATDGAPSPSNPLTPLNSGISQSLSFSGNNWVLIKNSATVASGTYNTVLSKDIFGNEINAIHYNKFNNPVDSVTYYTIYNDTLTFSYDYSGTVGSGATNYKRN